MAIFGPAFSFLILISGVCMYCSPIKRSVNNPTNPDCYGTDCIYDVDYSTETHVDVSFPDNVTKALLGVIPHLTDSYDIVAELLENMNKHDEQIQNLTSTLAFGFANILQGQMPILPVKPRPQVFKDCSDIAKSGSYQNGIYPVFPSDDLGSLSVYCDSGWTVFQRRIDGSVNFYRTWIEYESGFGNLEGEFWMGFRNIRRFTTSGNWSLMIYLEAFNGDRAHALYNSFRIGDAVSNYAISIDRYSGDAGDSLVYHNERPFTTKDKDNDMYPNNCAEWGQGAWWYGSCVQSNLNGLYLGQGEDNRGIYWREWKSYESLKLSEMKIRRV